jgi:hypothetical protein
VAVFKIKLLSDDEKIDKNNPKFLKCKIGNESV